MKKSLFVHLGVLIAVAFGCHSASAAIVLSDSFNTNGALSGQSPQVGGAWAVQSAGINPLTVVNNRVLINNNGEDLVAAFNAPLTPVDGNSIFTSQVVNLSAAQVTGDYFANLTSSGNSFFNRIFARSSGAGFQLGIQSTSGTGSAQTYGTTVLPLNTDIQVVTAWDFIAGGTTNDTFSIFVNPTDPVRANNTAYATALWLSATAEPTVLGFSNIRQGSATAAPTLTYDNLIVATTFAEVVTAVPEPSTVMMMGMVGLTVVAARQIRRSSPKADSSL